MAPTPAYPPGPKRPIELLKLRRDPPGTFLRWAQTYGDMTHLQVGKRHFYLLNHPDYVEAVLVKGEKSLHKTQIVNRLRLILGQGLLTSEDEFHLHQRRLIQPIFHKQRIAGYGQTMVDYAQRYAARWVAGQPFDMSEEMMALTMAIVGKTLFGADVAGAQAATVSEAMHLLTGSFMAMTGPLGKLIENLKLPPYQQTMRGLKLLNGVIQALIARYRENPEGEDNLLALLLAARDETDGQGMSDEQVRDEAMTLFLAGHETTSNGLTWTWYLLSQHPEVEQKLHAELDEVLKGRAPKVSDLPKLPYTRQVFSESLRLYPPAWVMGREVAAEGFAVGGVPMPPGTTLILSQWVMHHDPRFYPDPLRFDPERFTPEAQKARPKYAYFPFGVGGRLCIGEQFAWMEGQLLLATIAQRWRLRLAPKARVALQPVVTLRPRYGLKMLAEPR